MSELLVVAGEASGDRAAARVLERLSSARAFGLGGAALARIGVDLVADLRHSTALGFGEVAARSIGILRAWRRVTSSVRVRRPDAALLVNYTEFNTRLAPRLHAAGIPVIWYGAPQVWAWRPRRAERLGPSIDAMALMLPFEEPIWRRAGVKATYVGHPALEPGCDHRDASRIRLSIPDRVTALGILPGSRPHEVRRLLPDMLGASQRIAKRIGQLQARVVLATSLDSATRSFALATSAKYGIRVFDADPMIGATQVLSAFDVVVCASGTASLEAALAHAPPVVAYRVGVATGLMARAALRSPHIALPNIVLGRRAFAELVQHEASADRMATAIQDSLDSRDRLHRSCDEVAARLRCEGVPSENVARLLSPWVGSCGA